MLPLLLDFGGKCFDAQCLDQDLDPRLVLVIPAAMAVIDTKDRFNIGQQMLPWQIFPQLRIEDRRASQATSREHAQYLLARRVPVQINTDIMHPYRSAVLPRGGYGDLELPGQIGELGIERRPLTQYLRKRPR